MNYASIKGANRPCNGIRIERKRGKGTSGSRLLHQFAFLKYEDYEMMPERTVRDLSGASYTYPPLIGTRPVYRHITHKPRR